MNEAVGSKIIKVAAALIGDLQPRNRDIVSRRFGLKTGAKETLESIGRAYGITRERVRQIEDSTLAQVAKKVVGNHEAGNCIEATKSFLEQYGGVVAESDLFRGMTGNERSSVANASLAFVLALDGGLVRFNENNSFNSFWALNHDYVGRFQQSVALLVSKLRSRKQLIGEKDFPDFVRKVSLASNPTSEITDNYARAVLRISKDIGLNIYHQVGLVFWSEVKPRGVRDKAFLVLKKEGAPKHFTEIAALINSADFSTRKANVQTVHNELIKDNRFVLVGRGTYALAEWGYAPGTVKEVLVGILKQSPRPMAKADLVAKLKSARLVKENTILLNLQDSKTFKRTDDGLYTLREV